MDLYKNCEGKSIEVCAYSMIVKLYLLWYECECYLL